MRGQPEAGVLVTTRRGERALAAARRFTGGETILVARGVVRDTPTATSVQISAAGHLDVPPGRTDEEYAWRFLNHACRPNAAFVGSVLVACAPILAGEEITFDYETTEWEIVAPFACTCRGEGCSGREIRGFRHLSHADRLHRLPWLRDDLRRLVTGAEPTGRVAAP